MKPEGGQNFEPYHVDVSHNLCSDDWSSSNYFVHNLLKMAEQHLQHLKCPLEGEMKLERLPSLLHFTQVMYPTGDYLLYTLLQSKDDSPIAYINLNISYGIHHKYNMLNTKYINSTKKKHKLNKQRSKEVK